MWLLKRKMEIVNKGDETHAEAFRDAWSLKCSAMLPPDWLLPLSEGQSCQSSWMAVYCNILFHKFLYAWCHLHQSKFTNLQMFSLFFGPSVIVSFSLSLHFSYFRKCFTLWWPARCSRIHPPGPPFCHFVSIRSHHMEIWRGLSGRSVE